MGAPRPSTVERLYPKCVWVIIAVEFCERFSYYGFRAILALYLNDALKLTEDEASQATHAFIVLNYLFPLLGGWIADSYAGQYSTILYLSAVHCAGNAGMALVSLSSAIGDPPRRWPTYISLFLVAVGTGGIKPCVSAFAGDQFRAGQDVELNRFFSWFYISINVGALISMFVVPIVRAKASYSLAFALAALLMFVALFLFVLGRRVAGYVEKPPQGNVMGQVARVLLFSLKGRRAIGSAQAGAASAPRGPAPRGSWLDAARPRYGDHIVDAMQDLGRVALIFAPVPVFWSLYDQQSSTWTFQASHMDCKLGGLEIEPDQVQNLNSFLILVLAPLFDQLVYPFFRSRGMGAIVHPLSRMAGGMLFGAAAFVMSGVVEGWIVAGASVSVAWQVPQYILITIGEVLLSITGLEFAYVNAPASMKSVVSSLWLLTSALGNALDVVVFELNPFSNAGRYYFFAAMQVAVFALFVLCVRAAGGLERPPRTPPPSSDRLGRTSEDWGDEPLVGWRSPDAEEALPKRRPSGEEERAGAVGGMGLALRTESR
eukprot:tig00021179_g19256.t1